MHRNVAGAKCLLLVQVAIRATGYDLRLRRLLRGKAEPFRRARGEARRRVRKLPSNARIAHYPSTGSQSCAILLLFLLLVGVCAEGGLHAALRGAQGHGVGGGGDQGGVVLGQGVVAFAVQVIDPAQIDV